MPDPDALRRGLRRRFFDARRTPFRLQLRLAVEAFGAARPHRQDKDVIHRAAFRCYRGKSVSSQQVTPQTDRPAVRSSNTLQSWKEIAAYLKRGVRTVQRWERSHGLPVRR